ncbi:hypothetical protein NITHO_2200002 [Nitrolancea hollandica Lb]|uniref:Uncharacterized protein n=1 Tax=Nitrolancea hollandica Lb TaxID=1129897 RepID=I4EF43_9BACT|nr:hypothetical protein NITHO_2200002 [Nitrolancea hollandica Lb]
MMSLERGSDLGREGLGKGDRTLVFPAGTPWCEPVAPVACSPGNRYFASGSLLGPWHGTRAGEREAGSATDDPAVSGFAAGRSLFYALRERGRLLPAP